MFVSFYSGLEVSHHRILRQLPLFKLAAFPASVVLVQVMVESMDRVATTNCSLNRPYHIVRNNLGPTLQRAPFEAFRRLEFFLPQGPIHSRRRELAANWQVR